MPGVKRSEEVRGKEGKLVREHAENGTANCKRRC